LIDRASRRKRNDNLDGLSCCRSSKQWSGAPKSQQQTSKPGHRTIRTNASDLLLAQEPTVVKKLYGFWIQNWYMLAKVEGFSVSNVCQLRRLPAAGSPGKRCP